jgi:ketosteroid isomerase-like protein
MNRTITFLLWSTVFCADFGASLDGFALDAMTPEAAIRTLVRANADKDIATLARLMAHDADIVGYTLGGRKYVGWPDLERDFQQEFLDVTKLEIPIRELKVWTKGDVAWFAMELDYIRFIGTGAAQRKTVLQLRETGVLEKREGQWMLLSWHESPRSMPLSRPASDTSDRSHPQRFIRTNQNAITSDLSGDWDIVETDNDKHYTATLDKAGNGPYTQHGGRFVTTRFEDRLWQGTWHQPGNDREGGFELLLSEDGTHANGIWWYTRVGSQKNIPPREHGGTYEWKRLTPPPSSP